MLKRKELLPKAWPAEDSHSVPSGTLSCTIMYVQRGLYIDK